MGIISLQWHKSTLCLKSQSTSREVFTEIMFVEIIQNYGKKTVLESLFFDKVAGWRRPATLLTKTPTQVLCLELCEILKNTFFAKTSTITVFFVFSSRSVPIPKIITNRCGMQCHNVKEGVHRNFFLEEEEQEIEITLPPIKRRRTVFPTSSRGIQMQLEKLSEDIQEVKSEITKFDDLAFRRKFSVFFTRIRRNFFVYYL